MFANQYVENDALAADIVQECFVKLWQLRDDFMYVHQIKSFLYTSVRNKSLNELEHTKVMNEYAQKVQEMSIVLYHPALFFTSLSFKYL